jgi:UDP-N-acetylglucosamine--N-acetylmuramyl-(pentapeptide) pyrophosphoryl-undecaprenol N-acetylglucosamine transferase
MEWINIGGLRGKGVLTLLAAPFRLLRAVVQCLRVMWSQRPDVVVGLGGYVSGPGGVAAWLARRPLVIHEQNAIAGFTNRWLARLAQRVLTAFPGAFAAGIPSTQIGNPVRREFFAAIAPAERFASRGAVIRVLVVGGSQGAARLNELVPQAVAMIAAGQPLTIRHQTGARGLDAVRDAYARAGVPANATAFIDDIAREYAEADLVICRAGALTISELAAVGVAAILVPFPKAVDDHQTRNAGFLVDAGAALLMPEATLTVESLAAALSRLCADRGQLRQMAERARALAKPHATEELADICAAVGGFALSLGAA